MIRELLQQRLDAWAALAALRSDASFTAGYNAWSLEAFVLRHAEPERVGQPLPRHVRRGTAKQCFANAGRLVLREPSLRYVEGFVAHEQIPIPILHAWAIDGAGGVVDPTLTAPERYAYIGVVFPREVLAEELARNRVFGLLDYGFGFNVELMARMDAARGAA